MSENNPCLISCKPLKSEYDRLKRINITSANFTLGRSLNNSTVIPYVSISRNHCIITKSENNDWTIEDQSTFGIEINGDRLGKGTIRKLTHEDIITLEPSQEFVYKFFNPEYGDFEIPKKRIKLEKYVNTGNDGKLKNGKDINHLINDVKLKFEESQNYEMKYIEERILNVKQMQTTQKMLKEQLQLDMDRKIKQLEKDFEQQIENLKGEKNEVERQKTLLIEERNAQLATVKDEMEGKIAELMEQIQRRNETESQLLNENSLLKEKLLKEREEFLAELNRESSSKQDMLDKLNEKLREQEETLQKEKQEIEERHKKENELLRLAKEEEIKALEQQKRQREQELIQELDQIKNEMESRIKQSMEQQQRAEQQLNQQMEEMKKLSNEDKAKMEQLLKEREEISKKLSDAQLTAEKTLNEAKSLVKEREVELAALTTERIQQADQSTEVISALQHQLEKMRSQLQSVETEKNILLESLCLDVGQGTSKQKSQDEVGDLIENELQCSICAELFITATTLNCSHTFCKYCITMWKKKKKDCPICRAPITSECKSIVLDSLIEKALERSEESKKKREEILKAREELESELERQPNRERTGRSRSYSHSPPSDMLVDLEGSDEDDFEEDGYESDNDEYEYQNRWGRGWRRWRHLYDFDDDDSGSGSDEDSDLSDASASDDVSAPAPAPAPAGGGAAGGAGAAADVPAAAAPAANADTVRAAEDVSHNTTGRSNGSGSRRSRRVPGVPGSYYGGYGRCFSCGQRGHWAPGCPFR